MDEKVYSTSLSNVVDQVIEDAMFKYNNSNTDLCGCSFSKLLSLGELVDRLSIVNFKLFNLKNSVLEKKEDDVFKAWASVEDIKLVEERSRLKRCIDEKLIIMINNIVSGDKKSGFNPEVKKYG